MLESERGKSSALRPISAREAVDEVGLTVLILVERCLTCEVQSIIAAHLHAWHNSSAY